MSKIDFSLPNPLQYYWELEAWAAIKHNGSFEAINKYSHISRGYHGLFHPAFLWYCHKKLADKREWFCDNIFQKKGSHKMNNYLVAQRIAHAILGHDVIYNAKSKTNELDSANWWRKHTFWKPKTPNRIWVGNAIEASANHFADYPFETEDDILLQWFLGLDLIPLAAPWDIYFLNQNMIRAEYSHLTDAEWNAGRMAFLNKIFLHCAMGKNIYQHPYLRKRFEKNARANIDRALAL